MKFADHSTPGNRPQFAVWTPEYWPRIAFVALARYAEAVILADTLQYSRQSFHNRTRVRLPRGWHWLTVPLVGRQHGKAIADVEIARHVDWAGKHLRTIQHNYGTAPYYGHYIGDVAELLRRPWKRLGDLTCATSVLLLRHFRVGSRVVRSSDEPNPAFSHDALVARIPSRSIIERIDPGQSSESGARRFLQFEEQPRHQNFPGFERDMSALDLLFNHGPAGVDLLEEYIQPAD